MLKDLNFLYHITIYGRGGHLGHVTQMPRTNFPVTTNGDYKQHLALIGQAASEKLFEIVNDGRGRATTDGMRTQEHGYTISSLMSIRLR